MRFDIIIVSKDRHSLLLRQVKRIKNHFPYNINNCSVRFDNWKEIMKKYSEGKVEL